MKALLVRVLIVFIGLALAPVGAVFAHGEPVIAVEPAVVAAGGQITVNGTEMESGEAFVITLEGLTGSLPLGEAIPTGEGEEGGFVVQFSLPVDVVPGSYTVRAAAEEGEAAVADLTVTAPSEQASAGPATVREPTGELHQIDRNKPVDQIVAVIALIVMSSIAGLFLVRTKG